MIPIGSVQIEVFGKCEHQKFGEYNVSRVCLLRTTQASKCRMQSMHMMWQPVFVKGLSPFTKTVTASVKLTLAVTNRKFSPISGSNFWPSACKTNSETVWNGLFFKFQKRLWIWFLKWDSIKFYEHYPVDVNYFKLWPLTIRAYSTYFQNPDWTGTYQYVG